jgi:hypothetical protein
MTLYNAAPPLGARYEPVQHNRQERNMMIAPSRALREIISQTEYFHRGMSFGAPMSVM